MPLPEPPSRKENDYDLSKTTDAFLVAVEVRCNAIWAAVCT